MPASVTVNARAVDETLGGEGFGYGPGRAVPVFSAATTYAKGDEVQYPNMAGKMFKSKNGSGPAAWSAAQWTQVTV